MKTVKLEELLNNITQLPWVITPFGDVQDHVKLKGLRSKIPVVGFSLSSGTTANCNNAYIHHAANILPDLVAEQRFILGEIAIASCETDECKLSIMNELIRRSPGFTALIHAEKVNIPE